MDLFRQRGVVNAASVIIPLRQSQRDIGNLSKLTGETVNFILKALRARNLIEAQGHSIRVKNPVVLQHAVC